MEILSIICSHAGLIRKTSRKTCILSKPSETNAPLLRPLKPTGFSGQSHTPSARPRLLSRSFPHPFAARCLDSLQTSSTRISLAPCKIYAVPTINRRKLGCPKGCCGRNIECPCKTNHRLDFWATDQAHLHARARASPPGKQKKRKQKLAVSHGCLKEGRRWGFALAVVGGQPQLHGLRIQPSRKKGPETRGCYQCSPRTQPGSDCVLCPKV